MNIYVETNFILELALMQEQHESCNRILELCEAGRNRLILPAFCIAESYSTLIRQAKRRQQMANDLAGQLRQLSRSEPYRREIDVLRNALGMLAQSSQDEEQRLVEILDRILRVADIIQLETQLIVASTQYRDRYSLDPQDSIVLASVLHHLANNTHQSSCFINRNKRDFADYDIEQMLISHHCKLLFSFDSGLNFLRQA